MQVGSLHRVCNMVLVGKMGIRDTILKDCVKKINATIFDEKPIKLSDVVEKHKLTDKELQKLIRMLAS